MPRQRQPVDMVIAKGRKHFTKQDIEARRAQEIDVPFKDIEAPAYLTGSLEEEFYDIAYKLLEIGVMTELDEELLARYLISKQHYLKYSNLLTKALQRGDVEESAKLVTINFLLQYKQKLILIVPTRTSFFFWIYLSF